MVVYYVPKLVHKSGIVNINKEAFLGDARVNACNLPRRDVHFVKFGLKVTDDSVPLFWVN